MKKVVVDGNTGKSCYLALNMCYFFAIYATVDPRTVWDIIIRVLTVYSLLSALHLEEREIISYQRNTSSVLEDQISGRKL